MERGTSGYFLTREDLERPGIQRVTDAFRMIPNVKVDCAVLPGLSSACRVRNRRTARGPEGLCDMFTYVDGIPHEPGMLGLNEFQPEDIEGMEVYTGASIPARFKGSFSSGNSVMTDARTGKPGFIAGSGPTCGVIVIWTRDTLSQ
jgi:hypothetical protein